MKTKYISLILAIVGLFILTSCSNDKYDQAINNGIKSLGEKDYHQAAIYFEVALNEKQGDNKASSYFTQANQMENAIQTYKNKDFNSAINSLDIVINDKNSLETLQEEAKKLKNQIYSEEELISSIEEKMTLVDNLIKKNNYSGAQKQLQLLQKEIKANKLLANYQSEVTEQIEQVNLVLKEDDNLQQKDEPTKAKEQNENKKTTYKTYVNGRFGFSLQYPTDLMMAPPPTNGDGAKLYNEELEITAYGGHTNVVNQGETIETYYEDDLNKISEEVAYQKLTKNWYVLSYVENDRIVYKKFFFGDEVFNTFIITYPVSKKEQYDPVTTRIAKTFVSSAE